MKKSFFLPSGTTLVVMFMAVYSLTSVSLAVELKLAHFMPPKHIQHRTNFVPFAKRVAELSGGEVTIKIYPSGTLGGPKQLYDAAKTGITDIAFVIPSYLTGRFVRSSSLELPFIFVSGTNMTAAVYDVYDKYLADDFKDVKMLYMYATGTGQLHSAEAPIMKASDLKGMKIRTPNSLMTTALKKLGANPVGMPIPKLAVSLEKGVINGVLTPYSAITDFRLFDLVDSVTKVNMYVTFMVVVMNKNKFNSLSPRGQKAILEAGGMKWGMKVTRNYAEHDLFTLNKIRTDSKIKIKLLDMPEGEVMKMKQALKGMYADWVADASKKGVPAQEILDAIMAAAKAYR